MGVHFVDAHLIMNARLYGERHGLPVSVMNNAHGGEYEVFPMFGGISMRPIDWWDSQPPTGNVLTGHQNEERQGNSSTHTSQNPGRAEAPPSNKLWRISRQQVARVIEGELYVSVHHKVSAPAGVPDMLTKLLDFWDIPFCYHLTFSQALISMEDTGLYYLFAHRFGPCDNKVVSCMSCYTDVSITIRDAPRDAEMDFEVTTYHRLGRCRKPDDGVWMTFALPPGAMPSAQMRNADTAYPEGEVQNRWKISGGEYGTSSNVSWGIPDAWLRGWFVRPDSFWLN